MELIEKSKKIGFLSRNGLVTVNDSYYYLWMCELQHWLREKHFIDVRVANNSRTSHFAMIELLDLDGTTMAGPKHHYNYKIFAEALEYGLQEALKLIKS